MKIRIITLVTLIFISVGCATPERTTYKPITLPGNTGKATKVIEEPELTKTEGATVFLETPKFKNPLPGKELPQRVPVDPKQLALAESPVMINVEKMPLSDFIIYALGETLKVSFVMDEKTMNNKQPITMRMPQAMPPDKALEVLIGLFEKYSLYVEQKAGALYILDKPPEPKEPFDIRVGRDAADSPADILQVVPLRHLKTYEIEPLIKEMYKSGVQIKPYTKENVLILYGQSFQIKQVIDLVETFDVPYLQNKVIFLLRLTYWQTEDFISQLSKILEGLGFSMAKSSKDPGPLFLPIKQLNSILVVSPDEKTTKYILEWRDKLDTAEAAGTEEKSYIFNPQYSNASALVKSLNKLYEVSAPVRRPIMPKAKESTDTSPTVQQPNLRIAADDSKNIIIILASPAVYKNVLNLLKELDTPPRQVLIEATIAELTLTDELRYGLEWYLKNTMDGGPYSVQTLGQLSLSSGVGLSYQFLSETGKFQTMLNLFATDSRTNILSTPRLMVLDNMEATIQIGDDVPVVTGEVTTSDAATSPESTGVVRSIQYRSTGIILKVKPTINTAGLLTLDISQEVSELGGSGVSGSPIISTRRITTSVVAAHGQTVVLGGLMKETKGLTVNKVPLLGDIPLIGNLFKSTSKTKNKTELIVLVTPTIITSTDSAAKITEELRKELKWFK
ncbi:MAG: type II secretion system secretin GspD [Syntrophales bacterium]